MFTGPPAIGHLVIFYFELIITIIFVIEHIVRIWAYSCLPKFRGWRGLLLMQIQPVFLMDLFVLASNITVLAFDLHKNLLSVGFQGFRMLHFFENRFVF